MKLPRRNFLQLAAGAVALPAISQFARAQAYPSRPVTMIVPFAPGGGTDVAARIVGKHMARTLGQQIVIQNIAGAGGTTVLPLSRCIPRSPTSQRSISNLLAWSLRFHSC